MLLSGALWASAMQADVIVWLQAGSVATMTRRPALQRVTSALRELMMRIRSAQIKRTQTCALKRIIFFVISFYLQSVLVHSANCVKTYTVACREGCSVTNGFKVSYGFWE
jgi:hypothetical protein